MSKALGQHTWQPEAEGCGMSLAPLLSSLFPSPPWAARILGEGEQHRVLVVLGSLAWLELVQDTLEQSQLLHSLAATAACL